MFHRLRGEASICALLVCGVVSGCTGQLLVFGQSGARPPRVVDGGTPTPPPPGADAGRPSTPPDPWPPGVDAGPEGMPPAPVDAGYTPAVDAASPPPPPPPPMLDAGSGGPVDPGSCVYPSGATGRIRMGDVITPYVWSSAYTESGMRSSFDLERFRCGAEHASYTSVLFVIGTAWCPNCPDYMRDVAAMDLESLGTLVVFLETQDSSYGSASSAEARTTVDRIVGSARGIRIGDGDNTRPDAIGDQISSIPTGVFVRRRDMRILAFENELGRRVPWESLARDPEQDWVSILRGGGSVPTCGPADEETYEPNDGASSAAAIGPGTFRGGVCGSDSDYYRVSLTGRWRMDLDFRHATGDLDVIVTDASGRTIATSDSGTDDESVTVSGPGTIRIYGYRGAMAPYTLTLTEI